MDHIHMARWVTSHHQEKKRKVLGHVTWSHHHLGSWELIGVTSWERKRSFQPNFRATCSRYFISFQELSTVKLHIYVGTDNKVKTAVFFFSVSLSTPSTLASVWQLRENLTRYLAGVWCDMISPLQNSESHSAKLSHAPSATGIFWAWTQILSDYLWKPSLS